MPRSCAHTLVIGSEHRCGLAHGCSEARDETRTSIAGQQVCRLRIEKDASKDGQKTVLAEA
jgi:hypothetical protein